MNKTCTIALVALILAGGPLLIAQRRGSLPAGAVESGKWEYGVYRVGGFYSYEWQGPRRRTYAQTQRVFLEKMGLASILINLQSLTDAPQDSLEYVGEVEFLNYLGSQGWEMIFLTDRGPGAVPNKTFWFKRRR